MLASSVVVAAALLGGAAAQGQAAAAVDVNQLETARLTQAAQRVEFGVEGEKSAFKFSFSDPVRISLASSPASAYVWGCCLRSSCSGREFARELVVAN